MEVNTQGTLLCIVASTHQDASSTPLSVMTTHSVLWLITAILDEKASQGKSEKKPWGLLSLFLSPGDPPSFKVQL